MTKIKDCCVLITGGASGIGRIMGRMALERGARCLVIWDINDENIAATKEEYKRLGRVEGYKIDVSDNEQVQRVAMLTEKECGNVDILINCAAIPAGHDRAQQGAYMQHCIGSRHDFQPPHGNLCRKQVGSHRLERLSAH